MNNNVFNLLFDLDAMFDTRMGTLLNLSEDVHTFLPIQEYRNRTKDDFGKLTGGRITQEAFEERYAKRDIMVLRRSLITGLVPVVMSYIETLRERLFRGVDVSAINIDINIHPYILPGPIVQTIKDCLRGIMPTYVSISAVSYDLDKLNLDFVGQHYSGWATYDIHKWLEKYHEALLLKPVNGLSAIIPKLFVQEPGDRSGPESEFFNGVDRHGLLEMVMEDFIHLEHVPVSDFCFVVPGSYKMLEDQSSSRSAAAAFSEASTAATKSS
ncbi:hypothetical protein PA10_00084 [Pseudomonas phage pPa_SNUABM_DT01]|nr:hypothetical protein PA10_00084 [Pseudomonas phage pPa_SNUABM_DT01]